MSLSTIDPYAASYPPSLWEKPSVQAPPPAAAVEPDPPLKKVRSRRVERE